MPNNPTLPEDVAGEAAAICDAIASENVQHAAALLADCTKKFTLRSRTAGEFQHYIQWLRDQQAAARSGREHIALRLSATNLSKYGRGSSQATWSIDA
jgi:hypothetical protein